MEIQEMGDQLVLDRRLQSAAEELAAIRNLAATRLVLRDCSYKAEGILTGQYVAHRKISQGDFDILGDHLRECAACDELLGTVISLEHEVGLLIAGGADMGY